jgi:hypothetical protein
MSDEPFLLAFGGRTFTDVGEALHAFAKAMEEGIQESAKPISEALVGYLNLVAHDVVSKNSSPWRPGISGDTLYRRTGKSMQSILRSVRVNGTSWPQFQGFIGGQKTLLIHEFGGIIKAKGKLLAIPLPAALDSRGVPKKRNPRDWKNTFVRKTKAGNLVVFQRQGARAVPLYVLKSSVRIKPRLGLLKTLEQHAPYFMGKTADILVRTVTTRLSSP